MDPKNQDDPERNTYRNRHDDALGCAQVIPATGSGQDDGKPSVGVQVGRFAQQRHFGRMHFLAAIGFALGKRRAAGIFNRPGYEVADSVRHLCHGPLAQPSNVRGAAVATIPKAWGGVGTLMRVMQIFRERQNPKGDGSFMPIRPGIYEAPLGEEDAERERHGFTSTWARHWRFASARRPIVDGEIFPRALVIPSPI